jgi:hypothetical protein
VTDLPLLTVRCAVRPDSREVAPPLPLAAAAGTRSELARQAKSKRRRRPWRRCGRKWRRTLTAVRRHTLVLPSVHLASQRAGAFRALLRKRADIPSSPGGNQDRMRLLVAATVRLDLAPQASATPHFAAQRGVIMLDGGRLHCPAAGPLLNLVEAGQQRALRRGNRAGRAMRKQNPLPAVAESSNCRVRRGQVRHVSKRQRVRRRRLARHKLVRHSVGGRVCLRLPHQLGKFSSSGACLLHDRDIRHRSTFILVPSRNHRQHVSNKEGTGRLLSASGKGRAHRSDRCRRRGRGVGEKDWARSLTLHGRVCVRQQARVKCTDGRYVWLAGLQRTGRDLQRRCCRHPRATGRHAVRPSGIRLCHTVRGLIPTVRRRHPRDFVRPVTCVI